MSALKRLEGDPAKKHARIGVRWMARFVCAVVPGGAQAAAGSSPCTSLDRCSGELTKQKPFRTERVGSWSEDVDSTLRRTISLWRPAPTLANSSKAIAQGSRAQPVPLLECCPLDPLIRPRKQIGDLADGGFTNGIAPPCRRQVQQLDLDVGCEVVQTNDLTDSLAAEATQPREIRIVLSFASSDQVL